MHRRRYPAERKSEHQRLLSGIRVHHLNAERVSAGDLAPVPAIYPADADRTLGFGCRVGDGALQDLSHVTGVFRSGRVPWSMPS